MIANSAKYSDVSGRYINGEGIAAIGCNLPGAANLVEIAIQNSRGHTVHTVTMRNTPAGGGTLGWGGNDNNNSALPAGIYSFSVNVVNAGQ